MLLAAVACTVVTAVGVRYLWYDYNLLNLQPAGLESVELEHKLFNQTNRSAWFALSIASTPEEVLAKRSEFLKLASVERVEDAVSKLPCDCEKKRPIIERIHQRLANLPQEVPQIPVTPLAELDRMLAGAQTMLLSMPEASQATESLRQMREMLRCIPPDEYERRVREYQQAMAADLLGRLRTLQAASTPELPQVGDLPESVVSRFVGKTGRYLMQVYSKANIWEVGPMGQFVKDVRTVDPKATGNPLQVYEASWQMKHSFEQAACYALLMIVPVVLLDFRRLNTRLLAALPMGVGLLQTLGPDGPARHPAESGQHDRAAADARHRHGKRHQPAPRTPLPTRTLSRPGQRRHGRRRGQFAHHDGRLRRADDRQSSRAAKPRPRADDLDGLLPVQFAPAAESAGARPVRRRATRTRTMRTMKTIGEYESDDDATTDERRRPPTRHDAARRVS